MARTASKLIFRSSALAIFPAALCADLIASPRQISESAYRRDPVSKVSLLTLDMEKSIDFYQDVRET